MIAVWNAEHIDLQTKDRDRSKKLHRDGVEELK